jgi:hypothetical protein
MEQERYVFSKVLETVGYEFISEGPKGEIKKRVLFRLMEETPERIYNISFGDSDGSGDHIDDEVVSNNADSQKVLHTVVGTALEFIRKHQDAWLHAEGSTPSRTRLYQMGIGRFWKEIAAQFIVIGLAGDEWLPFRKGINYEAFLIRHK